VKRLRRAGEYKFKNKVRVNGAQLKLAATNSRTDTKATRTTFAEKAGGRSKVKGSVQSAA
jgi:hypothetical protein